MNRMIIEEEKFEGLDYSDMDLPKGNYENCTFRSCNFSDSDLSEIVFEECEFEGCNLSMGKLIKTAFREVKFTNCNLLGLHFENCNDFLFSVEFKDCLVNISSFYQLSLKGTTFKECKLQEVDFTESDLSGVHFDNCDLTGAIFENTILEKTDFRTAYNYSIDPEINRIKKAKFTKAGIVGLLDKYDIEIE